MMCFEQCFCQTRMIHSILGISPLNNAFLESKHHSSDAWQRQNKEKKQKLNTVGGWHLGAKYLGK